jgi:hypothetical protein
MRCGSRRVLLCFGIGALLAGCLSPTLPLPPPSKPDVEKIDYGVYEVSGTLPMPGTVYVRNERTSDIFGKNNVEQLYRLIVEAEPRDVMGLWYEASDTSQFYGDRSATISFEIPDDVPATPADGGPGDAGPTRSR